MTVPIPGLREGSEAPSSGAAATRILIADDQPTMREAVRELLEDMGFQVVGAASDGLDAVGMTDELRPDVVVMDLRMPVLDGIEATRRIRTAHPGVRVVLLSAYDDSAFRTAAAQAGASDYVAKGCSPEVLERVLRAAAERGPGPVAGTVVVPDADDA